ncbi:helix-turn-helix transcriptional regulator [Leptolyngbya sp. FACHB-671]|nr:helix-turn-helix transcriptional regulator [Leptolyngbya sp. FACHB-671]
MVQIISKKTMNNNLQQPPILIDRPLPTSGDLPINSLSAKGLSPRKLRAALEYIHLHMNEGLSLEAIAAHVNMSQFHFCRLFKQSIGVSPYHYLLQQRVERAKQLLLQNQLSIADIALEVGFSNQSHLCFHFKRSVGTSPKQFAQRS